MKNDMYDEKGILKSQFGMTKAEKKEMNMVADSTLRPIDKRTDFGRGITYMTCDGKSVATMEDVIAYNEAFYEKMKKENAYPIEEERGRHL